MRFVFCSFLVRFFNLPEYYVLAQLKDLILGPSTVALAWNSQQLLTRPASVVILLFRILSSLTLLTRGFQVLLGNYTITGHLVEDFIIGPA